MNSNNSQTFIRPSLKKSKIPSIETQSIRLFSLGQVPSKFSIRKKLPPNESPSVSRHKLKIKNSLMKKSQILKDSRNSSQSPCRSISNKKISLKKYISSSWLINKRGFVNKAEELMINQMKINSGSILHSKRVERKRESQEKVEGRRNLEIDKESDESFECFLPFLKSKLYYDSKAIFLPY